MRELTSLELTDKVLANFETMLRCDRRGLCLLRQWMRPGRTDPRCRCHYMLTELLSPEDLSELDEGLSDDT